MATQHNNEATQSVMERTPLLGERPPSQHERSDTPGPESEPIPARTRSRKSWYAWRLFWALLAITVIGVFVKGWIDADETEVFVLCRLIQFDADLSKFDLRAALKRALGGGLSGAAAMVLQVLLLMVCLTKEISIIRVTEPIASRYGPL